MDARKESFLDMTVEDVFQDFKGRREALIKAMTTDFEVFYDKCDPGKENLSLYGYPDGSWDVEVPIDEVPPEFPEPVVGINFSKEGMRTKEWLSLVAIHSDAWLISLAFYLGARLMFDKNDRKRLFRKINGLPKVYEVVIANHPEQLATNQSNVKEVVTENQPEQLSPNQSNGNETKISGKMPQSGTTALQPKQIKMSPPPKEDGDSDEEGLADEETSKCGACGDDDNVDGFWICCDVCEKWFHGQCVRITPAKAEHIKYYKCPGCSMRKARVH